MGFASLNPAEFFVIASVAKQSSATGRLDCFVAPLLAMTRRAMSLPVILKCAPLARLEG
jgi:hypothetical protein